MNKKLPQIMSELLGQIDPLLAKLEELGRPARRIAITDPQVCAWCNYSKWHRMFGLSKRLDGGGVERVQLFQCRKCHRYTVLRWQE